MPEISEFKLGELTGQVNAFGQQLSAHVKQTDDRFLRLENTLRDGFRESQADREAGNKTLGEMIQAVEAKVDLHQDELSERKGAISLGDRWLDAVLLLFGGVGAGLVAHFFPGLFH